MAMRKSGLIVLFSALFLWFASGASALLTILAKPAEGFAQGISGDYSGHGSLLYPKIEFPGFMVHSAFMQPAFQKAHIIRKQILNEPEQLQHVTYKDVLDIMGQPFLTRKEGPSALLQYASTQCVVDFYFKNDNGIVYYEMRSKKDRPLNKTFNLERYDADSIHKACMNSIFREQDYKTQSVQNTAPNRAG